MNIYQYFNSPDVATHLRKIEHPFTAAEAAYVVNECLSATLEEKIAAWKEIISAYPDHSMEQRPNMDAIDSVHSFLRQYISVQQKKLSIFMEEENCVYDFSYVRAVPGEARIENNQLFCNVKDIVAYCMEALSEDAICHIIIRKRCLAHGTNHSGNLYLNSDYQPIRVEIDNLPEQEAKIDNAFDAMWFSFPVPFRRGDIVIDRSTYGNAAKPMVVDDLPIWYAADCIRNGMLLTSPDLARKDARIDRNKESGDNSDMAALCCYVRDDGILWSDFSGNYLHFEYYREPLCGRHRLLQPLGAFLSGTINPELLCNACCQIYKQIELDEMKKAAKWYTKEALVAAGMMDNSAED